MSENTGFTAFNGLDCSEVKVGDVVHRMISGIVPMDLRVTEVDESLIHCGGGWTFDRRTGAEVDEDLGWDAASGTGSMIVGWDA